MAVVTQRSAARAKGTSYHHGDLATALTDVATDLARSGGPESIVLREAARRVGVSATAAYRHFAGHHELMEAVKDRALAGLASAMRANVEADASDPAPIADAIRRVRAIGRAYIEYALAEPGLFRTAFCPDGADLDHRDPDHPDHPDDPDDPDGMSLEHGIAQSAPYQMLTGALDELACLGALAPTRRPFAEVQLWATVHGLSLFFLDGPLRALPAEQRAGLVEATMDYCLSGIGITA